MDLRKTIYKIARCGIAMAVIAAFASDPLDAKDNFFKRSASAVKEFFTGGKQDDADAAECREEDENVIDPVTDNSMTAAEELELLYDSSLDDNVRIPKLLDQKEAIRAYQLRQAKKLVAAGEQVETMRNGEVIIATIECNELFLPNDTVLKPTAAKYLKPYVGFLKERDMYRMLLAMHSDDTGSAAYTDNLTSARVLAVLEWFQQHAAETDYVIPYAMGASEPLYTNNSVENRSKNRRLEIYLVPGRAMIQSATEGKLPD